MSTGGGPGSGTIGGGSRGTGTTGTVVARRPTAPADAPILVSANDAIGLMAGSREQAPSAASGGGYFAGQFQNHEQRIRQLEAQAAQNRAQAEY